MSYTAMTQALPEEQSGPGDETKQNNKYAYLIENDRWHEIAIGETKIGRDASLCSLVLNDETVSKEHAVVECEGGEDTYIYDLGSRNKTKLGTVTLRPHCRYKINNNDELKLGSTNITFKVLGYKITNHGSKTPPFGSNLHDLGKNTILSNKESVNSSDIDGMLNSISENNVKEISGIFKCPSMPGVNDGVFRSYCLLADESSFATDIFSQETQCDVKDADQENTFTNDNSQLPDNYDDIYNLSTQCEYASYSFLRPKDKVNSEKLLLNPGPSTKLEKSKGTIDCVFSDSGTYDFVKGNNTRNHIPFNVHELNNEDMFEIDTPCQTKLNDLSRTNESNELNFKNKINQPVTSAESLKIKLNSFSDEPEKKLPLKYESVNNGESSAISLSDGEDEELCKVMGLFSPIIKARDHRPVLFRSTLIKTDLVNELAQHYIPDEVFDIATQVSSIIIDKKHAHKSIEIITPHKGSNEPDCLKESKTTFHVVNSNENVPNKERERYNTVEFNKLEGVSCSIIPKNVCSFDEDMVLTQAFSGSHHNAEIDSVSCSLFSTVEKTVEQEKHKEGIKSPKTCERKHLLEDLLPTQLFRPDAFRSNNYNDVIPCSEDEISTQIFPAKIDEQSQQNSSERKEEKQIPSIIIEEPPPKPVPDVVELYDSDNETPDDLDIQLCLESLAYKKEEMKKCTSMNVGPVTSSRREGNPERPSSSSSDKTVSDLDIIELQEISSSLLESSDHKTFISNQAFTSKGGLSKTRLPSDKTNIDIGENLKKKTDEWEDLISRDVLPIMDDRNSPPKICCGNRYIRPAAVKTKSRFRHIISKVSSEEETCNIEDKTSESESLFKDLEDISSSSPYMFSDEGHSLKSGQLGTSGSSLTLTPSHPVFEAFSEIDGLIGNNCKTNDKSDSGIGPENFFEKDVSAKGKGLNVVVERVISESDETDCEEELLGLKNNLIRQETFVVTNPKNETISQCNTLPLPTGRVEDAVSSMCNPSLLRKVKTSHKTVGKPALGGTSLSKNSKPKSDTSIQSYFLPKIAKKSNSPRKRTLLTNQDEGATKKRVISIGTRKKKAQENIQTGDLPRKSLAPRSHVTRQRKTPGPAVLKKKTSTEKKTAGRDGLVTDFLKGNVVDAVPRVSILGGKKSAIRKLTNEFEIVQEEREKVNLRPRESCRGSRNRTSVTKIVFTCFESDSQDRIIQRLGGEKVNNVDDGHVLVTDRARRTVKFLSAVALGLPVVSPKWLTASEQEMKFLNPWNFLLEDKASEERWRFSLRVTLLRWRKKKLLEGYTVFATEHTQPPVPEILSIAKCCGGLPVTSVPDVWPEMSIVVTCLEDKKLWPPRKFRHVKILHYEFLLSGVLKHFMDFNTFKLR